LNKILKKVNENILKHFKKAQVYKNLKMNNESNPFLIKETQKLNKVKMLQGRKENVEYIKSYFPKNGNSFLEIGPNLNPMILKNDNFNVKYLDLVGTDVLLKRAINKGKDISKVPEIDYIHDPKKSILETVGKDKFDVVLSAHVIEHIPDFIKHFQDVSKILNPSGVYCLIIPNMYLCFDAKKSPTTLGNVVEAFLNEQKQAPISRIIDEFNYGVKKNGLVAWSMGDNEITTPKYPNPIKKIKKILADKNFVANWHGHIWYFHPYSFGSIYLDCFHLGLVELELIDIKPTKKMEFICILQKRPLSTNPLSRNKLRQIFQEQQYKIKIDGESIII
jgi:SAM-dependent methyltransferase